MGWEYLQNVGGENVLSAHITIVIIKFDNNQ